MEKEYFINNFIQKIFGIILFQIACIISINNTGYLSFLCFDHSISLNEKLLLRLCSLKFNCFIEQVSYNKLSWKISIFGFLRQQKTERLIRISATN